MAARFWVTGGTGNWNSTTNWSTSSGGASGASVPGSADTAAFDASSGSGTVTLDISPDIQTLTCTGFTGTLAFGTNTISLNSTGTIFTVATTMTVTGTPLIICTNSSATARTITTTTVTEANSISFRITDGTGGLTLSSTGVFRNLDFTDGINPTGFAAALGNNTLTIYGNFKASTGMTRNAGTSAITFAATSGTKTIDLAGVTFDCPFIFNGVGGTFQLQAAMTSGATRTTTLTNGTLDLNGYTLTIGLFSSNNSNVRTLAFGIGQITVTGSNATIWSCTTLTNFNYTGTSAVNSTYSGSTGTRVLNHGNSLTGTESNAFNFNISAGTDTVILTATFFANNLNFTGFAGTLSANTRNIYGNLILSSGMTLNAGTGVLTFAATSGDKTITTNGKTLDFPVTFDGVGGTWTMQDALTLGSTRTLTLTNGTLKLKNGVTSTVGGFATSGTNQKFLQSTTAGVQATISQASGTVSVSYLTIQDIAATGGATWNAFVSNQNINIGNNTGWDFNVQPGRYIYTRRKNKRILP